jgi:hypothetical protein
LFHPALTRARGCAMTTFLGCAFHSSPRQVRPVGKASSSSWPFCF